MIAAGQRTDELLRVQAPDAEVLHGWADELLFYIPAQDSKAMQMFQAGQREVLAHRKSGKHALSLPVLRNEGDADAGSYGIARGMELARNPLDRDRSMRPDHAEQSEEQVELTLALEPAHSQDLSAMQFEVHAPEPLAGGQVAHRQQHLLGRLASARGI